MDNIASGFAGIKRIYDAGGSPVQGIKELSTCCLDMLRNAAVSERYGCLDGKDYVVFRSGGGISRPVRWDLFIFSQRDFQDMWDRLVNDLSVGDLTSRLDEVEINSTLYTAIMSFSSCYDIWKNSSRKTPGTYFEIILGSLLSGFLRSHSRGKHIPLPSFGEQVATDIVFDDGRVGFAIPVKITTRERVVQPYAHQRILDSVFGVGRYKSILLCVSETQRDDKKRTVNNICVPGTLKLFQAHLSSLSGLYYLDPPLRYLSPDVKELVPVGDYGDFFKRNLRDLLLNQSHL